jgi:hypothetical protein
VPHSAADRSGVAPSQAHRNLPTSRRLRAQHIAEPDQLDEPEQLGRGAAQANLTTVAPRREREPRERVDGHRIGVDVDDLAQQQLAAAIERE